MSGIFRSVKFNVVLFLIIAALSALGTFIPQLTDNADKVSLFLGHHPYLGGLLNSWGFFDLYHTFLFAGLLGLMAMDVVLCKLWNKPPDPGLIPLQQDEPEDLTLKVLRQKPYRLEGTAPGTAAGVAKAFALHLKKQSYSVKRLPLGRDGVALVGARHRLQRWGSYVSHISIVVILLGALLKSLMGFETFLPVLEGQSANIAEPLYAAMSDDPGLSPAPKTAAAYLAALGRWPKHWRDRFQRHSLDPIAHWSLAVQKLTVDFYKNSTTPSTFASKVRLYDAETPLADTTIRVNQPLDVHHIRFYQASWGVTGMIRGALLRVGDETLSLKMKESFPVPGQPWRARVEHYLPDFVVGQDGQPTTASLEWKNPALVLGFYNQKDVRIGTLVLGAPSPVTPPEQEPWGMFFFAGGRLPVRPPFEVIAVEPLLFSGVQVSYDPGFPFIVVGVLSMLIGLMALFYLHQRRVMVFIRPSGHAESVRIEAGGWSSRGEKDFQREFQALFSGLKLKEVQ